METKSLLERILATIISVIQVYANNIIFILKNKALFIQNLYELLIILIFPCYLSIHIRPNIFWFFVFLIYNSVYSEYTQCYKNDNKRTQKVYIWKLL